MCIHYREILHGFHNSWFRSGIFALFPRDIKGNRIDNDDRFALFVGISHGVPGTAGASIPYCENKKLPLSSAALVCGYTGLLHQYSDCGGVFCPLFTTTTVKRGRFGKRSGNFFVFPVCSLQQSGGVVCQRFLKMGAKKAVNLFKIYCLSAAVMGGGIKLSAVFQMELICNRFLSAFQFLFCNLP